MYIAEVYVDNSSVVFSLKHLKSKSATFSASNLEDSETLAGLDGSDRNNTAIIIYTSGSTGTPKGNKIFNGLKILSRPPNVLRHFKEINSIEKNDKKSFCISKYI